MPHVYEQLLEAASDLERLSNTPQTAAHWLVILAFEATLLKLPTKTGDLKANLQIKGMRECLKHMKETRKLVSLFDARCASWSRVLSDSGEMYRGRYLKMVETRRHNDAWRKENKR